MRLRRSILSTSLPPPLTAYPPPPPRYTQAELRMELAASRPKYEAAVLRVQAVKSDFEAALSKQMDGRRINLMGAINAL